MISHIAAGKTDGEVNPSLALIAVEPWQAPRDINMGVY